MADTVSPAVRSRMMAGIKGKNTKPEILIRQLLHRRGFRFRLHKKDLPGCPDIVLSKHNVVIFVNGCFWHGHENCKLFSFPKTRTVFWRTKIDGNKERDFKKIEELCQFWRVLIVWECAVKGTQKIDQPILIERIEGFLLGDGQYGEIRGREPE